MTTDMARLLDLKQRNDGTTEPSSPVSMQNEYLSIRDIALTAATVMPASLIWIVSERFYAAVLAAVFIYGVIEIGYPHRSRVSQFFSLRTLTNAYHSIRGLIPSRTTQSA